MAQPAWNSSPSQRSSLQHSQRWGLGICPSAWPRRSTPSVLTLLPRVHPVALFFQSGMHRCVAVDTDLHGTSQRILVNAMACICIAVYCLMMPAM